MKYTGLVCLRRDGPLFHTKPYLVNLYMRSNSQWQIIYTTMYINHFHSQKSSVTGMSIYTINSTLILDSNSNREKKLSWQAEITVSIWSTETVGCEGEQHQLTIIYANNNYWPTAPSLALTSDEHVIITHRKYNLNNVKPCAALARDKDIITSNKKNPLHFIVQILYKITLQFSTKIIIHS